MGSVYMAECEKCDYSKRLFAGGGRMDCMPQHIIKELPEKKRKLFEQALADGATRFSVNRLPCVCGDCGEIYAVPIVTYMLENEKKQIIGECPKCSSENYTAAENSVCCPVCEADITLNKIGLWD